MPSLFSFSGFSLFFFFFFCNYSLFMCQVNSHNNFIFGIRGFKLKVHLNLQIKSESI